MPVSVSTGSLGEPRAKRCRLCDESRHRNESGSGYWQLQLDRDLVETISVIYPDLFKPNMSEGGSSPRESPPKAVVDTSPLLNSLEQNKESLKVKLMLRRPVEQLVDQGIMPPLKTPAAFHGQRRQLERAKTGDLLKSKIQQRPTRTELESRHILEPDPHVDPSLADKQRKLKKARLADQLNDQLSHRPGPLELIRKNILHTEEPIEHAVKAGHIPYRATCEGQLNRPQHPLSYVNPEDDSQSSEDNSASPGPSDALETAAKSAGIVVSLIPTPDVPVVVTTSTGQMVATTIGVGAIKTETSDIVFADLCRSVAAPLPLLTQASATSPASLVSSISTLSPLSSIASPVPSVISQPATPGPPIPIQPRPITTSPTALQVVMTDAPGKEKKKKSKSKATPKVRTIKFHEYKGPSSAHKSSPNSNYNQAQGESSYQLLLQQQQLLLQYQLQLQHKNSKPCLILPASQTTDTNGITSTTSAQSSPSMATASAKVATSPAPNRLTGRLEDLKVTDLRAELKRRNLPVSGSKPQLIERLKPFVGNASSSSSPPTHPGVNSEVAVQEMDAMHNSPMHSFDASSPQTQASEDQSEVMEVGECDAPSPMSLSGPSESTEPQDVIVLQERRIKELERHLTLTRLQLQQQLRLGSSGINSDPKPQYLVLQKHLQARQEQNQLLQQLQALQNQQNENQQLLQQQQHVAFQNQKNLTGSLVLNGNDATIILNPFVPDKSKLINGHNRSNSLPNFINTLVQQQTIIAQEIVEVKPPPMYDETKFAIKKKDSIKSQAVEDVLDILIKNGELPPSAAQDPGSANSVKMEEPEFPGIFNNVEGAPEKQHNHQQPQGGGQMADGGDATLGVDASDILNHLDLEVVDFTFMELCEQNQASNNNAEGAVAAVDQVNVSMETDDWLESFLPSSGPTPQSSSTAVDSIRANASLQLSAPEVDNFSANTSAQAPSTTVDNFISNTAPMPSATTLDNLIANATMPSSNNNAEDIPPSEELGYDPLLAIGQNPLDPFNLDDFRSPSDLTASLSWDRLDFTA